MRMTCPYCGASIDVSPQGTRCKYCGSFVEVANNSQQSAQNYRDELHNIKPSNESNEHITDKRNAARDVYEENIAGVCIIQNIEDSCSGSGFIYKDNGLVITNAHVIYYDKENRPSKKLNVIVNGKRYEASVVNSNAPKGDNDVALIKINSNDYFHSLETGNINDMRNGDEVIAIGNPKGEGLSITRGIVSDIHRQYGDECYLMSDVTINPGNSGGPLFNEKGQVIAICVSSRVEADNMNFFIPINHVLEFIRRWGY